MNNYPSDDLLSRFIAWYSNEFRSTPLFTTMTLVKEDSPYHRERNVGVHTDMVVNQYIAKTNTHVWGKRHLIGAIACAFHDVGKPAAMEKKFCEDRGNYLAFRGHELISARLWEDWVVTNWSHFIEVFPDFSPKDIFNVGWMIEHHLQWDTRKPAKIESLARTSSAIESLDLFRDGLDSMFCKMLESDTHGRLADDSAKKTYTTQQWIDTFYDHLANVDRYPQRYDDQPTIVMLIGPSGSGKSTYCNAHSSSGVNYSHDALRHEWYGDNYKEAFYLSTKDRKFNSKANSRYMELIKANCSVIVDNTNTSRKARRFFIDEARKRGYYITAILFPVDLETVINRQQSRHDKTVPEDAVISQYKKLQLPHYGEFDNIIVSSSNLI